MRDDPDTPTQREFPSNWDVLQEPADDDAAADDIVAAPDPTGPTPILTILAASWADAVAPLGVCTAALIAAVALVVVRQGTPGMLLAGVVFAERVAPGRVAAVIAAAAVSALLLGLPNLLGPRRSPLAVAAASELETVTAD
jgi:hypothetical protein